ncbi:MAG: AIR synthase-related protein, partial [Hyphococcus sp.]
ERMLMVLKPGSEEAARAIFEKWEIDFAVIGVTTDSGRLVIKHKGETAADMPVPPLADAAPNYDRPAVSLQQPAPLEDPTVTVREAEAVLSAPEKSTDELRVIAQTLIADRLSDGDLVDRIGLTLGDGEARIYARSRPDGVAFDGFEEAARNLAASGVVKAANVEQHAETVSLAETPGGDTMLTALAKLMTAPDLCSRRWIWTQYDHTVMGDTVIAPGGDAALVRVHGTNRGLAISTDVTPRYVAADPREGGKQAVAETYRNICATGAAPLAVTNCLNFGNPERPEIMAQFVGAVEGMAEACEVLNYPVVSGNVSLYNETNGVAIPPTPAIGGVGVIEDVTKAIRVDGAEAGDELIAIGVTRGHLGRSLYLRDLFAMEEGAPPPVSLEAERKNGELIRKLIDEGLVTACHDVSDGGLLVAAAEMALAAGRGLNLQTPVKARQAAFWFGEDQGRYLVAAAPAAADTLLLKAAMAGVQASKIGRFGGPDILLDDKDALSLLDLSDLFESALPDYMNAMTEKETPMPMAADDIKKHIVEAMPDAEVEIEDLAGDGDHYRARIVSAAFNGKNRVQQHQLVYKALKGKWAANCTHSPWRRKRGSSGDEV